MIKEIFEWFILIWTSLLVLLISGWLMNELYEWDKTIIAAIIAFIGAIMGGMITWIGVNLTIKSNHLLELDRIKKEELMYLYPLKRELEKNIEHIYFEVNESKMNSEYVIRYMFKELSFESKLYDYAQRSDSSIYNKLQNIKESVRVLMDQIYTEGSIKGKSDLEVIQSIQEQLKHLVSDIQSEIDKRVNSR